MFCCTHFNKIPMWKNLEHKKILGYLNNRDIIFLVKDLPNDYCEVFTKFGSGIMYSKSLYYLCDS